MAKLNQPIHGIRCTENEDWEVWSIALEYPLKCGSPVDAKRVAAALEVAFPRGARVDYSAADAARCFPKSNATVEESAEHFAGSSVI